MSGQVTSLRVRILTNYGDNRVFELKGRPAWTLNELIQAGPRGCTPIERPGPRWSSYVHILRALGFYIETIFEPHKGYFPGHHGRYVLRDVVGILPEEQAP